MTLVKSHLNLSGKLYKNKKRKNCKSHILHFIIFIKSYFHLPVGDQRGNKISLKWLNLADGRGTNWIKSHIINKICSAQMSTPISKIRWNVLKILRSNVLFSSALLYTQSAQMSSAGTIQYVSSPMGRDSMICFWN